jgi:hypothetical protein
VREIQEVVVAHAVLQLVAPRSGQIDLSQVPLPLDDDVAAFLTAHIVRGLHDSQAKAADFVIRGEGRTADLCNQLLADETRLVEISQQLAENMYKASEDDDRISDGTLAVCLCDVSGAEAEQSERILALLKLDPSPAYRTVVEADEHGQPLLRLALEHGILPSLTERVQKCAFIRADGDDLEFQMLLVDRQRSQEGAKGVARFFIGDFLGAEQVMDAPERTRRLYKGLKTGYNKIAPELEAEKLIELDEAITQAVSGEDANVDEIIAKLPVDEGAKQAFDDAIVRRLPQRQFDLDMQVAERFIKRRNFEGDNGLRLSIPAEYLKEMITVEDVGTAIPVRRIVIETELWKER